jgi:hypothetical protein
MATTAQSELSADEVLVKSGMAQKLARDARIVKTIFGRGLTGPI